VLFIHAPTAIVPSAEIAAAVAPVIKESRRNVLACWLGGDAVRRARDAFAQAGIPTYDTPEEGMRAFTQMGQYRRNQNLLMEVPPSRSAEFVHDRDKAHTVVTGALADGRILLSEPEANAVLAAYSVPVVDTCIATTGEAGGARNRLSRGTQDSIIRRCAQVRRGWRRPDLGIPAAVEGHGQSNAARLRQYRPDARLEGFTVQTPWRGGRTLMSSSSA
jgi:acetyltransferase